MKAKTIDLDGKPYNRFLFILAMIVGAFCVVLNQTILATAYPTIMKDFHVSISTVEWLTTAFLLVNGITIPFSAVLMNKINSKYLFIATMIIFFVGTLVCATAPTFVFLLLGRVIQAVGVGIAMPLLQTSFLNIFTIAERGMAMGIVGLVIALAPSIGPTLSGYVVDHYSWRFLFYMILPIVFFDIIACFFFLRKVVPLTNPKIDVLSGILSVIGFGGLLYGFSIAGNQGWLNWKVLVSIGIGIIVLIFFCIRQFKIPNPFLRLENFKYKVFSAAVVITAVSYMAMLGFESILPLFIQKVRGESAFHSGLLLLPGALIMGIMSPITGYVFDRKGAKRLAMTGLLLLAFGTFPFLFITDRTPVISISVLYALRLFGISMVLMPVTTSGMNQLPNKMISDGTAINNTLRQVASSIGTAILVSTLSIVTKNHEPAKELLKTSPIDYAEQVKEASTVGYQTAFGIAFGLCLMAFFFTFILPKLGPPKNNPSKTDHTVLPPVQQSGGAVS